jgi:hypothetical protein
MSIAMSAVTSLIWTIFYLFFRRNIQIGFHLFYASFIGGVLGSIPGIIIGFTTGFMISKAVNFDADFVDFSALFIVSWALGFCILGILVGSVWSGRIILEDYQRK